MMSKANSRMNKIEANGLELIGRFFIGLHVEKLYTRFSFARKLFNSSQEKHNSRSIEQNGR